ncbi:MAG: amidohydrolase family protein [Planctomycetaceae bacterium]|nr:amidohydrolase family protein [Planctomycetaceae bacterium]
MSRLLGEKCGGPVLAAIMLILSAPHAAADTHAFFVGRLWPGDGAPIEDAVMLVKDSQVAAVGQRTNVEIPEAAIRHELGDVVMVPGFVIAETSIGVASDDERTLTPEVRAIDGFDLFADYSQYTAAGVTTVQISPGRQRLMPGLGAVVKLAGDDPLQRVLTREESLRIILSNESSIAPRIYEPPVGAVSVDNPLKPTRPQLAESLAARLSGLRAVFAAAAAGDVDPDGVLDFDALRASLKRGRLRIKASTAAEIQAALNMVAELQAGRDQRLRLTLTDATQLDSFLQNADALKDTGIVLNAGIRPGQVSNPSPPSDEARPKMKVWEQAAALFAAGATDHVAVRPAADSDLDDLLFLAGLFTRGGTSPQQVLQTLTANPARILGVDARVGSLTKGKDADFVVLSGDPFASGTAIESTWINGQQVYHRPTADVATIVKAAHVYASADDVMADAGVLVSGKKIQAVGSSVSLPEDVSIKRFPNGVIVPGFVDMGTGLGFGGSLSGIKLTTKIGDRLAIDDRSIAYARQGGVTTAVFVPAGSSVPMLAFKLGDKPRLLKEPVGIRFAIPSNLTSGIPGLKRTLASAKAYHDSWTKYEVAMKDYKLKLAEYEKEKAKYEAAKKAEEAKKAAEAKKAEEAKKAAAAKATAGTEAKAATGAAKPDADKEESESKDEKPDEKTETKPSDGAKEEKKGTDSKPAESKAAATPDPNAPKKPAEPKKPRASSTLEPYRALMSGEIPAFVEAKNVLAIEAAVKLFREEFQLKTILIGADEAHRTADLLSQQEVQVSVGPTMVRRIENKLVNLPQVLTNHQVPVAFQSNATTGVQQLPLAVQYSVFRGLSTTDALKGLTSAPAHMLSLQSKLGTIEPGKDADLVVLSGPPFEPASEVIAVMIDGEWVYERGASE